MCIRWRNASSVGLQLREMQLRNYNKNFLLKSLCEETASVAHWQAWKWVLLWQAHIPPSATSSLCKEIVPVPSSFAVPRCVETAVGRGAKCEMFTALGRSWQHPKAPLVQWGSVGDPWAHRLPGAAPALALAQAKGTAPEVAHSWSLERARDNYTAEI